VACSSVTGPSKVWKAGTKQISYIQCSK